MDEESKFINELKKIEIEHNYNPTDKFNIFKVLHKSHDERRLHSRFLSNLLAPNSNHGKKTFFLEKFIDFIKEENPDFSFEISKNTKVKPNEFEKSEWNDIDIYIENDNQAIIIENKIFAGDSNKINEDGSVIPQLIKYRDKVSKAETHLIYLTLNGKEPSYLETFKKENLTVILLSYINFIRKWLEICLNNVDDYSLKNALNQYRNLVLEITNDYELAIKLKGLISNNIHIGYQHFTKNKGVLFKSELKHVKWHTVHEFCFNLKKSLQNIGIQSKLPSDDLITKITHNKSRGLRIHFTLSKERKYYISNDSKGFTWGYDSEFEKKKWFYFKFENANNIIFSKFENLNTFKMINETYRENIVSLLVSELSSKLRVLNT